MRSQRIGRAFDPPRLHQNQKDLGKTQVLFYGHVWGCLSLLFGCGATRKCAEDALNQGRLFDLNRVLHQCFTSDLAVGVDRYTDLGLLLHECSPEKQMNATH